MPLNCIEPVIPLCHNVVTALDNTECRLKDCEARLPTTVDSEAPAER